MKKLFTTLLLAFTVIASYSNEVTIDFISYDLDHWTNEAVVTSCGLEYPGSVTIPSTITYDDVTYSVTSIRWGAFWGCTSLTSVDIPNSVVAKVS